MQDAGPPDFDDPDDQDEPRPGHGGPFLPDGFPPPPAPRTDRFWLEPLGPEHNDADFAAWRSSIEHIHATAGFRDQRWPHPMTAEENLADLARHATHFRRRLGFTYTVRDSGSFDVIGCVYIYPDVDPSVDAHVRSWVRASRGGLDPVLAAVIQQWLDDDWPFTTVRYR